MSGDAAQAAVDGAVGDRQEAHCIGEQKREHRAAEDQAGRQAEDFPAQCVDPFVQGGEGDDDADGENGARHGVAERREAGQAPEQAAGGAPGRIGQEQGDRHRDQRRRPGQNDAGQQQADKVRIDDLGGGQPRPPEQRSGRRRESEYDRRCAENDGKGGAPAGESPAR